MANIIIMPFNALSDHLCFMGGKHCHHGRNCSQWRSSASRGNLSNHSESFLIVEQSRDWPMWLWRGSIIIIIIIIMNQQHCCVFVFFCPAHTGSHFVLPERRTVCQICSAVTTCKVRVRMLWSEAKRSSSRTGSDLVYEQPYGGYPCVWELEGAFRP